jgi:2-phospho-L-lactate/phosphoenolpyruvate guanylyltransferase
MRTAAILPVKRFAWAKQRLGASVADALRLALAGAMVDDVLDALAQTEAIACTIVITNEQSVAQSANARRATVIADTLERGQSAAASLGIERALADGIERVLCVPGDCPTLDPVELHELLALDERTVAAASREVVIVPDRHGTGTNGLLLRPPHAIAPSFGPDSCERHRALARAAGVSARVERVPSLLLDIDTGADLDALRTRLRGHLAHARRTRAVLGHGEQPRAISAVESHA